MPLLERGTDVIISVHVCGLFVHLFVLKCFFNYWDFYGWDFFTRLELKYKEAQHSVTHNIQCIFLLTTFLSFNKKCLTGKKRHLL